MVIARYVQSLIDAIQEKDLDVTLVILIHLKKIFDDNKKIYLYLKDPRVSDVEKIGMFNEILIRIQPINNYIMNFFILIVTEKRIMYLDGMLTLIEEKYNELMGIVYAVIHTPFPLSDTNVEAAIASLEKRLEKKIILNVKINKSLIGGIVITYLDKFINLSLQSRLEEFREL
ncbi:MAG: ATP synthase F1 subunit delta [Candidatus Margulisbacteria bacterium GWE2_39_32]|nr:MAG: ATP synthase F1 subunit delta [Candidatus Margulisbacteria bacterium GWE2_39_32]